MSRHDTSPRADATPTEPLWPPSGATVTVVSADGQSRRTRVVDLAERMAVVPPIAPGRTSAQDMAVPGDELELHWPCERGLYVQPLVLCEPVPGDRSLWWLDPTGPVELHQRRSFVRAAVHSEWPVRVAMTWVLPSPGTAQGDLVDLGEGGLRADVHGWHAPPGAAVMLRLTLAEGAAAAGSARAGVAVDEFEFFGTAVRAVEHWRDPGVTEVIVQFHDPERHADDLRALVFAWQRAARRARRA